MIIPERPVLRKHLTHRRRIIKGARKEGTLKDIELPFSVKTSIESLTRDLTTAALREELEPVRCRDAEIERVIITLLRQSKNNPVLIGEAGVGKTAVVEGLAQRVAMRQVPASLLDVRILALSHLDL